MASRFIGFLAALIVAVAAPAAPSQAADLLVLTTGAPKTVVTAVAERFVAVGGHRLTIASDTAGGVRRRIEAGEAHDMIVATPAVIDALIAAGRMQAGSRVDIAQTRVGVGVAAGAPRPDISTVEAFVRLLREAPAIALPDPVAGGTSAVFLAGLFERLGVADMVRAKSRLKAGGYAAELVAAGEAPIVIHQMSEISPVAGVVLVGPIPDAIQLVTVYSAGLAAQPRNEQAARGLIAAFTTPEAAAAVRAAGMEQVVR